MKIVPTCCWWHWAIRSPTPWLSPMWNKNKCRCSSLLIVHQKIAAHNQLPYYEPSTTTKKIRVNFSIDHGNISMLIVSKTLEIRFLLISLPEYSRPGNLCRGTLEINAMWNFPPAVWLTEVLNIIFAVEYSTGRALYCALLHVVGTTGRDRQTDVNRETTRETDRPLEAHVGKLFWTCMSCELIWPFPWSDDSGGKLVKRPRDRREDNVCWDYSTASTGAAATSGRARDILSVHSTTGITTNYAIKEERAKLWLKGGLFCPISSSMEYF